MSIGKRILWAALLLTLVAALWPIPDTEVAESVATAPRAGRNRALGANAPSTQQLRSLTRSRPASQKEIVDLFPRQGWTTPAATAAPEKPVAPPLPFTYGGRYTEGINTFVFMIEGAKMHTVRQGDTVNGTYRIEKIAPASITLTYLPLGLQQTLQTGSPTPQ